MATATTASVQDVQAFCSQAAALASDAGAVLNAAVSRALPGGRFATPDGLPAVTEAAALAAATTAQAAAAEAAAAVLAAAGRPADLPSAVQALIAAVFAGAAPGDRLRAGAVLAAVPGGSAAGLLCRRLAVCALAEAAAAYQPPSWDDAQAVLAQVSAALDLEITVAGDAGDDSSYAALRDLRAAVVADLLARGASLAPLVTRRFGEALPALVMAAILYGDAGRADELVRRLPDWPHPLFMPAELQALGA